MELTLSLEEYIMKTSRSLFCTASVLAIALLPLAPANSQSLELLSNYFLPDGVFGVSVEANLAYIANDFAGIEIINVADPYLPFAVGSLDTPGFTRSVFKRGNYLYVADGDSGLAIIDVSAPSAPVQVGNYDTSGTALTVFVPDGNYAYVANGYSGMLVVDITDPANPALAGSYSSPGYIMGVHVVGNYALITANFLEPDYGELQSIDVSNPATPLFVAAQTIPGGAYGVHVSGGFAYVGAFDYGLRIIDVTSPGIPSPAGFVDTPGSAKHAFVNQLCLCRRRSASQAVDVANPYVPATVGSFNTQGSATDIAAIGNYVYVADEFSLAILGFSTSSCNYVPGDINGSGAANGLDVIYGVSFFKGGAPPPLLCPCPPNGDLYVAGDVNASCQFSGPDITYFVAYLKGSQPDLLFCPDCSPPSR
jgi:hypothetical protein